MRRPGELLGRRIGHRPLKQPSGGMRGLAGRMSVIIACILLFTVLMFSSSIRGSRTVVSKIKLDDLWGTAASGGWRPSSSPRSDWPRCRSYGTGNAYRLLGAPVLKAFKSHGGGRFLLVIVGLPLSAIILGDGQNWIEEIQFITV